MLQYPKDAENSKKERNQFGSSRFSKSGREYLLAWKRDYKSCATSSVHVEPKFREDTRLEFDQRKCNPQQGKWTYAINQAQDSWCGV